ncbi:MAG: hypothetical protein P8182_02780 [Deltaproteobacteria bacterium]
MKKMIFTGVLVFSLALNAAVFGTLAWNQWFQEGVLALPSAEQSTTLTAPELREIRSNWPERGLNRMRETRERILEKKREIIDLIAKNPGNPRVVERPLSELISLRAQQERDAVARINKLAATMPAEQRDSFLRVIRDRTCMGPGMGRGMGPGMGRGMGMGMGMGRHMRGPGSGRRWMRGQ